jgi:hypothetical protein
LLRRFLLRPDHLATLVWENISFIYPNFDANDAKRRVRFDCTEVDVRTQCMQRNLAFDLFFTTGDFRATQASTNDDPDAFGISTHGLLDRLLHGSTE